MERKDVDLNAVTPVMKQYLEIKNANEDLIIFFRLGDFYEMFFDDAIKVSRELELTLTGKSAGLEERIPMCGIPYHSSETYIEKLLEKGYKIGVCEQLEDPKTVKGLVKRGIVQIISQGTITNSDMLKANDFNYIANIVSFKHVYGVSYADVSTGQIYVETIPFNPSLVISEVNNLGVKEIVVSSKVDKNIVSILKHQFHLTVTVTDSISENNKHIYEDITDYRCIETLKHLLAYIENNHKRDLLHFQKAILREKKDHLKMDAHTVRNLELVETLRLKERNYSLIWLLDKTKTAMGARTLKNYILNPLINRDEIARRHDIVSKLLKEFILKDELEQSLCNVYDLERLSGKAAFGNINARDMLQLKNSIKEFPKINEILSQITNEKIEELTELYEYLDESIYEEPPMTLKEGYLIKEGFNKELDELKTLRKGGKDFVARFEMEEREKTGIKNLKVAYNRVFGYYIEISKSFLPLVKEEWGYQRKQTLANCERFISPILKEKEALILNAEEKIVELEYNLFLGIRDEVRKYIPALQENAKRISEIDVLQSFAKVTEENNYVRPVITENEIDIVDSRHPVVEKVVNNEFVSNDIKMDKDTNILLITGPNMAGKSTYMRQMAILAIMNQIGCPIPAASARMPIFDAIFTRIGASDDLVSGESTFMVEMIEANNAISNATDKSLILFDELGRGTATFDGMALAQAIIEYIHKNIHGKTFFSTHYHELTDLEINLKNLKNIHVSAYEEEGKITFLHKIKEGSVDKSYGIHVASLANLPSSLIKRAESILKVYENKEMKRDIKIQESLPLDELISSEDEVAKKIKEIDPLNMTPLEALDFLYELKKSIEK